MSSTISEKVFIEKVYSDLEQLELEKFNAESVLIDELAKAEAEFMLLKRVIKNKHKPTIEAITNKIKKNKYLIKVLNDEIAIPDSELTKVKEKWDDKIIKAFDKVGKPLSEVKPKEVKIALQELYPYFEFTQIHFNNAWALFRKK